MGDKHFTINDLPTEEKPRERLAQFGANMLSLQELLQVILGRGSRGESVTILAQKLFSKFGSLQKLAEASLPELSAVKGIGAAKATQLKAVFEIGRRISTAVPKYKQTEVTDPETVYKLVQARLPDYNKERFYLIVLNSRNYTVKEVSIGTLNASLVHPREAFTHAIKAKAAAVIFAHNHPSGDPEPSDDDLVITKRLVEAGKILGIEVLDHVIVTKTGFVSLKEKGIL